MSRHRRGPAPRLRPMRRATGVRPRYGRLTAASSSLAVSAVAVLGGTGLMPVSDSQAASTKVGTSISAHLAGPDSAGTSESAGTSDSAVEDGASQSAASPAGSDETARPGQSSQSAHLLQAPRAPQRRPQTVEPPEDVVDAPLPADSGSGRRVVFSEEQQRVWLVDEDETVRRTYLVSGSVTDNLHPGTYEVYSRSEDAWGIDDSGTMHWFVRFTHGENAAIGFHDIPVLDGVPLQKHSQLGTPQSHGCVRQREVDAKALWRFAPLGTTVVVV